MLHLLVKCLIPLVIPVLQRFLQFLRRSRSFNATELALRLIVRFLSLIVAWLALCNLPCCRSCERLWQFRVHMHVEGMTVVTELALCLRVFFRRHHLGPSTGSFARILGGMSDSLMLWCEKQLANFRIDVAEASLVSVLRCLVARLASLRVHAHAPLVCDINFTYISDSTAISQHYGEHSRELLERFGELLPPVKCCASHSRTAE